MIYEIKAIQFPIKNIKGLPSHFKIKFINDDYCNIELIENIANTIKYSLYNHIKPVQKTMNKDDLVQYIKDIENEIYDKMANRIRRKVL